MDAMDVIVTAIGVHSEHVSCCLATGLSVWRTVCSPLFSSAVLGEHAAGTPFVCCGTGSGSFLR